jgi:hypothetical protein
MPDRYLVISADCHAGLPNEQYRPYIDPQYREAFDDFLVQREAMRQQFQIMGNKEFEDHGFDLERLQPLAERVGPTPAELGQTDPSVLDKWVHITAAGRPWITGIEAAPVPARSTASY